MLLLVAFSLVHVVPEARADGVPPGWLSGYTYRKKHLITGAAGAGVGYQMMFIVRRASGTDVNNTVYVSSKCKEDFSDVRFADADGNVFPYAITYKTSDEAWFWIKPSLDLSQNQYIYIYYGNPDARDESSLDSTFVFAEPWDNTTLNSRWTVEASGNGYLIDSAQRRIKLNSYVRLKSTKTLVFPSGYRVEKFTAQQYATSPSLYYFNVGAYCQADSNNQRVVFCIHNAPWGSDFGVAYLGLKQYIYQTYSYGQVVMGIGHGDDYTSGSLGLGVYCEYSFYILRNSTSSYITVASSYNNGVSISESNIESADRIYLANTGMSYGYIYAFKIRKYVYPEPGHGEWYQEEAITVTQARLNVNVEPSWLSYVAFTLDYPTQVLFAPWSNIVGTGSHTLTVLDEKVRVNGSYVFGFKCWKKAGEIVSFDKSYTFTLSPGTTDITIVYVAHNVSIVSDPEMYVRVKIDDFQVQTPTTVYRGSGYYNFEALDTQLYYNATHMLKFYGWYVDNVYIGSDPNVNIYISYKTTIKLAYKAVEVPAPPPMTFKASVVDLGQIQAGTSKDFAITVTFDATALTIQSVEFQAKSDWLQVVDTMPMYATKGLEAVGTATIMCRLTVPQNVQGYYSIPYKVTAKTSQDITITTSSYITFTATPQPVTVEAVSAQPGAISPAGFAETVQRILGNPLILILLIALTIWLAAYTIKKRS